MTRLFVYGSLLHGEPNHAVLEGARCVGPARTIPRYALIDLGAYPALVAGADAVVGEVYEIDAALRARLDEFEDEYRRSPVELDDGTIAETYVMDAAAGPRVQSGDWRAYLRSR